MAEDIQAQLKQNLNITITINKMESGAFLAAASAGKLPLFMLGWGADYPDQTNFLDFHFGAGANDSFGKKFDDLTAILKQAASLAGDDKRKPLYEQANDLVRQHVPMVSIAHGGSAVAFKADIKGAQTSPLGNEVFADSVALATIPLAIIARMTRASMLDVLGRDYVRTAHAKGLANLRVIMAHAFRNALLPIATIIGLQLGGVFSGAVLTETIFGLAGVGRMLYEAITARDYPVIQGFTLVIAFGYVAVNLLVDLSYAFFDPRIRFE